MKAAVLHAYGEAPKYEDFTNPVPTANQQLITVKATSLKQVDKGRTSGTHYAGYRQLPVVCGVDGVGVLENGSRVYFGWVPEPYGTMAEQAIVPAYGLVPIPDSLDDVTTAALLNPAMSAYLPLTWRAKLVPGETVLILGATGVSGKLAIQLAKQLGAGRVVAAGRNQQVLETLPELGADSIISLDQPDQAITEALVQEGKDSGYDIVLDFVWGHPAEVVLAALTGHDLAAEPRRIRYVEIGAMAGPTINLPAAALRSTALELYGSGGGSVPPSVLKESIPQILKMATEGKLRIEVEQVPLSAVEQVWFRGDVNGHRVVFIP